MIDKITPKDDIEYCKQVLTKLLRCYSYLDIFTILLSESDENNSELELTLRDLSNKIGINNLKLLLFDLKDSNKNEREIEYFNFSISDNTNDFTFLSKKRSEEDFDEDDFQEKIKYNYNKSLPLESQEENENENTEEKKANSFDEKDNNDRSSSLRLIRRNLEGQEKIINLLYRENPDDSFIHFFVIANINKDYRAYMFCHDRKCKARAYYDIRKKEIEILTGHTKDKSKHAYLSNRCKTETMDNIQYMKKNSGIVGMEITKGSKKILNSISIIKDTNLKKTKGFNKGKKIRIEIKFDEEEKSTLSLGSD